MVSRLLEQRWPVTATLSDSTVTQRDKQYLDLKADQWGLLEELCTALKPFECATVFLSGDKYTTISAVPPLVQGLVKSTQSAAFETAAMQAFQRTAKEQLQQRWKNDTTFSETTPSTVILSSALDPRFRKLKFLTSEQVFNVQNKIQTYALRVSQEMHAHDNVHDQASSTSTITKAASGSTTLDTLFDFGTSSEEEQREVEAEDLQSQVRNEVLSYFGEKPLAKEENPLHWWKANEYRYPTLARLAKTYLCIPCTSTPSERFFSAAGNIASRKRASLSPEHLDMLTFLHCNAKFVSQCK
ncbi:hypothetical protein ACEWY4_007676 [Coilia grayii]|uniref:HAT C-terminal dimerisation domain-containing protein n=1 Tax=Coilia grayii TaxID=363190 RepID=A0ABD1K8R4_9TELE